jgi:hypothetical protein
MAALDDADLDGMHLHRAQSLEVDSALMIRFAIIP